MIFQRGERRLIIADRHAVYAQDAERYFEEWWSAVEPDAAGRVDYSEPKVHWLNDWGSVYVPAMIEPIRFMQPYVDHAQLLPGCVAIDAGAFAGIPSMMMALKVGVLGRVISLEPDTASNWCAQLNFDAFEAEHGYAPMLFKAALGSHTGLVPFNSEGAMGSARVSDQQRSQASIDVPQVTLRSLCDSYELERVDYVKLDIEGAETSILEDAEWFAEYEPRLTVACHYDHGVINTERVKAQLAGLGYSWEASTTGAVGDVVLHATPGAR